MTQTQRKPPEKIELAPNQVYIKRPGCLNPLQTLIEGAPGWSFCFWEDSEIVGLYYKGRYVAGLEPCKEGRGLRETYGHPPCAFVSLSDAVQHYIRAGRLASIDEINQQEGLEDWCIRTSFTPATLTLRLKLPSQERKRVERVASLKGDSVETLALQALYALLPELEAFYKEDESEVEEAAR